MKVVINNCWGGFSLSNEALAMIGIKDAYPCNKTFGLKGYGDEYRADERLIKAVETLGKNANGSCAELKIVEVPNGIKFHIDDYDGCETIIEDGHSWC